MRELHLLCDDIHLRREHTEEHQTHAAGRQRDVQSGGHSLLRFDAEGCRQDTISVGVLKEEQEGG